MDQPAKPGSVTVGEATSSDQSIQLIGYNTLHMGPTEEEKARQRIKQILQWVSPPDQDIALQRTLHEQCRINHKYGDTGRWFIESDGFQDWLAGRKRLTWVDGKSACCPRFHRRIHV